jgi:hypothetical protein
MIISGVIHHLPASIYHADPAPAPSLSSTLARKLLAQSPLHAWTACPRLNPDWEAEEKPTFDIGRAAHRVLLGAGADYAVIPADLLGSNGSISTKDAKSWVAEQRAAGVTPIKAEVAEQIEAMAEKARAALADYRITLDPARSEVAAFAEIDGVWCRAMFDNVSECGIIYDFKTCEDASPDAVLRSVERYGYDVQAAHYLDVWRAATGEDRRFRLIFQEKAPPHEVAVVELYDNPDEDADWMLDARSKAAEARRIWGECLAAGEWPGYPRQIAIIGARRFHRDAWAHREIGAPVITKKPSQAALRAAYAAQSPQ